MSAPCPLEEMVAASLTRAKLQFTREDNGPTGLDFHLPEFDIYIEVKRFHTDRIAKQTARAENVIVLQGIKAVHLFCDIIEDAALL